MSIHKIAILKFFLLHLCNACDILYWVIDMTTGERIKLRRNQLRINADTLAEKVGVSRSTVFRWEKGEIEKVPLTILGPLSEALQTTPEYLMGWSDDPDRASEEIQPPVIPLSEKRQALINLLMNIPNEKIELFSRIAESVLEDARKGS